MKLCKSCKILKPISDYYIINKKPAFRCKTCKNQHDAVRYLKNRDIVAAKYLEDTK